MEGGITGFKLEDIKSQWDKIAADADKYYDSVEGAYKIQAFANKIDDTIAGTTNIKNQQKLQKFREKEFFYQSVFMLQIVLFLKISPSSSRFLIM